MSSTGHGAEVERKFVERISDLLLSLPFDLKILQEAVTDLDLEKPHRLLAASTIFHTILPQEGEPGPLRYVDDVLFVRAALNEVGKVSPEFRERFNAEIYGTLDADLALFNEYLGELWPWLCSKLGGFQKLVLKGKKSTQAVEDDEAASLLYDEGLEFQTNYPVNEEQVRNKVRRGDQILEMLKKRFVDDKKRIG